MARKTINVATVVERANTFLAAPDSFTIDGLDPRSQRLGVCGLLESILHETGNYAGFRYQTTEWDEGTTALRADYDDSRRIYFPKV